MELDVFGRGAKGSSGSVDVVMRSTSISSEPKPPKPLVPSLRSLPMSSDRVPCSTVSSSFVSETEVWPGVGEGVEVIVGTKAASLSLAGMGGDLGGELGKVVG